MGNLLWRYGYDFLSLLFPAQCNACGGALNFQEKVICTLCASDLPYTDFHLFSDNAVAQKFWGKVLIPLAYALFYFRKQSKVQQLIHNLKYQHQTQVGIFFGKQMGQRLLQHPYFNQISLIMPVPLHAKRQRQRGYNQSSYIARGISEQCGIPFSDNILRRSASTESQTHKSRTERFNSMENAFKVRDEKEILNKHILLVDDIITTGATLEACARAILGRGAQSVSIAALAFVP